MARAAWNKGLTKETNDSLRKTSQTMRRKKLDNFSGWRKAAREDGRIKYDYLAFDRTPEFAELIGVILGDGYLGKHPRTECLRIVANANNPGFIDRYTHIIEQVVGKQPSVRQRKNSNAVDLVVYEKYLSKRFGMKAGSKRNRIHRLPRWIHKDCTCMLAFLRGLYETDGALSHHEKTYTHKFVFRNYNQSLLGIVDRLVRELGFHTCRTQTSVQVSRKKEVEKLSKIVHFREYSKE